MAQAAAHFGFQAPATLTRAVACVVGAALVVAPAGAFVLPNAGVAPLRSPTTRRFVQNPRNLPLCSVYPCEKKKLFYFLV